MPEWGSNPESFAAVGTVAAAVISAVVLLLAVIQLMIAGINHFNTVNRGWHEQAKRVYLRILKNPVHPDWYPIKPGHTMPDGTYIRLHDGLPPGKSELVVLEVENASDSPVIIAGLRIRDRSHCWPFEIPPEDMNLSVYNPVEGFRLYLPRRETLHPGKALIVLPMTYTAALYAETMLGLLFEDDEGESWTRYVMGGLKDGYGIGE